VPHRIHPPSPTQLYVARDTVPPIPCPLLTDSPKTELSGSLQFGTATPMAGILLSQLAALLPSEDQLTMQTFPFKRAVSLHTPHVR